MLPSSAWRAALRVPPPPPRLLCLIVAGLVLLALAGGSAAQEVRLESAPVSETQRMLERFLEEEAFRLWTRDTVLARTDTVRGPLLVLQSAARLEGRVEGSVYVVDGDLFLRPGSRVTGDVVVLGGGFYRSDLATVEGRTAYRPNEVLRAVPEQGGWTIFRAREELEAVELGPLYGLRFPTRQRVDDWTLRWGGRLRALTVAWRPELDVELRYKTGPGAFEGSLRQVWHPREDLRFGLQGGRATRTREAWIRPDLSNTVSFILVEEDYRNYYRGDRAGVFVEAEPGRGPWLLSGSVRWEEARSLAAADRWSLFDDEEVLPNPPIDEGEIWSVLLAGVYDRREGRARLGGRVAVEVASRDVAGDFGFLLAEARGTLRRPLPWGHVVEAFVLGRGVLDGTLPSQRWSALGGVGTLPTFPLLGVRGPRMTFGELTYAVPIPWLQVPTVGPTQLFARAALGAAWGGGTDAAFEQDLMAGLRFLFLEAGFAVDPGRGETDIYLRSRLPRTPGER